MENVWHTKDNLWLDFALRFCNIRLFDDLIDFIRSRCMSCITNWLVKSYDPGVPLADTKLLLVSDVSLRLNFLLGSWSHCFLECTHFYQRLFQSKGFLQDYKISSDTALSMYYGRKKIILTVGFTFFPSWWTEDD